MLAADTPSKPGDDAVRKACFNGFFRFEIGVGGRKLENALDRHAAVPRDDAGRDVADAHEVVGPGFHGKRAAGRRRRR